MATLILAVTLLAGMAAQQSTTAAATLVLDGVTVVDVEHGKLVPDQRVTIVGNRIQAVGSVRSMSIPTGARVVSARGKYLIPGLWDMHVHPRHLTHLAYPLYLANGVTGIRDAGSPILIDTLVRWRREILAGTRVGPPRQILSGQSIAGPQPGCDRTQPNPGPQTCVSDTADARYYVDSLRAAGADMIKPRAVSPAVYFAIAAEARRLGIPFGGHGSARASITLSDSGASIVDHRLLGALTKGVECDPRSWNVAECQKVIERLRRNNTWLVPTLSIDAVEATAGPAYARILSIRLREFWGGASLSGHWLRDSATSSRVVADSTKRSMVFVQRIGLPLLAGTDGGEATLRTVTAGFALHAEIAIYVEEGLTTLNALQSVTLNPAKMLRATDSLGTIAPGKLADLVLLDADPLADITNTTTIRAVIANGRYFDRAGLDKLLADVQAQAKKEPSPMG